MKRRFLTILAAVSALTFLACTAFAEPIRNPAGASPVQIWTNYAGVASTAKYSDAQKADRNTKKAFFFVGYSSAGVDQLTTIPGTVVVQSGPTSSGPWVTVKDVNGNALSLTTSGPYHVDSLEQWYRLKFTKTATDTKGISAWMITADQ